MSTGKSFLEFLKAVGINNPTKDEDTLIKQIEASIAPNPNVVNGDAEKLFCKLIEIILKKNPANLSKQDKNGATMLHHAAGLGLMNVIDLLLAKGASTATEDNAGAPPLAYAERGKHERAVAILLDSAKEGRSSIEEGSKTIQYHKEIQRVKALIEKGDLAALEKALQSKDIINCEDKAGATLLQVAAFHGNLEAIKLLLSKGANINSKDNDNISGIHKSVIGGHLECTKFLISKGANVNVADNDGLTPLHHACYYAKFDIVKLLIAHGATIGAPDNDKSTPLHHAVASCQPEIVDYLTKYGANVNAQDSKGGTPLHIASRAVPAPTGSPELASQLKCTQILINLKGDVNKIDSEGMTPVHHSCLTGHIEITKLLLDQQGILVNGLDNAGSSPLHKACFHGHTECVKMLLAKDAEIHFPNGHTSPLHHAAFSGHTNVLQMLLREGAEVNCRDAENATPLHKASFNGHVDAVKILLDNGADLSAQDEEGSTPLHKAAFSGMHKVVQMLLQNGSEVDAQDGEDGTPLHNACFNGHIETVKLLLQSQANLNCADEKGASPLHLAVLNGHVSVAQFLVERGAQVDTPDDRGMTALHHAIAHTECLAFLLEKGAEIDVVDSSKRTPLFYAAKNSCEEPARFLILKGADVNAKDKNGVSPLDIAKPSFQKVIASAMKERENQADVETQKKYQAAVKLFNQKPKKGIEFLESSNILKHDAEDIAKFLHTAENLNKKAIGEYLGEGDPFNVAVLTSFVNQMDLSGLDFDDALRHFLSKFVLPGEAQKIDRMMERFAIRFTGNNPGVFPNQDTAYILAFSLIMLNTDAHSPHIKQKMTKEQFIKNNRGICGGSNSLPREYMESMYDKIAENEIKMQAEGSVFTSAEKKGWCKKQGGRWKTWKKRWFVLKDNCLYYFKLETDTVPYGLIPLENLIVRPVDVRGHQWTFEVYSSSGEIKSCKLENGQLVKGHHGNYVIEAASEADRDAWITAIRNNISFNPLFELLKKRLVQAQNSRVTIEDTKQKSSEFQEYHNAALMCSMGYKSAKAIKEAYGMNTYVVEDTTRNMQHFMVSNERTKSQIIVVCGLLPESYLSVVMPSASSPKNTKSIMDVYTTFSFSSAAENIDQHLAKFLKKDYNTQIFAHGLGAALAVLLAFHLQSQQYKIEKVITFGQPKIVREKDLSQYKSLPITRIVDFHDPVPLLFPGYSHAGKEIILFKDNYFCESKEHLEDPINELIYANNHIEYYLRNLKGKLRAPVGILYEERSQLTNVL